MDFKKLFLNKILILSLLGIFIIGTILWKLTSKTEISATEAEVALPSVRPLAQILTAQEAPTEDAAIQKQLDRDREEQKKTKYLKTKLEQTDLELQQEKALAEINKLRMENMGTFKEPSTDGQNGLPEVKVQYIGGDSVKKEAILSIAGTSFQVKEKASPTDNIQVVAISDSSVTLHFNVPQEMTKTFDYKPE